MASETCPICGTPLAQDAAHFPHLDPNVTAVWGGDESRYVAGVPNRNVTAADGIDPDLLEEAFASGTHSRPKE